MPSPLTSVQMFAPVESVASLQAFLADGGRFLLTFAMALFLSYLMFMVGSIVVAITLSRVRSAIGRPAHEQPVVAARRGGRLTVVPGSGSAIEVAAPAPATTAVPRARRARAGGAP